MEEQQQTKSENTSQTRQSTPASAREHRRTKPLQAVFLLLVVGVIGFGGGWLGSVSRERSPSSETQRIVLDEQSNLISGIAKNVGKSVVSINVTRESTDAYSRLFGGQTLQQQSAGTGIILSKEGLIITNRHVIPEGTTAVSITLSDGTTLEDIKVVGRTNENDSLDVAFLQVEDLQGKELVPAKLGASSAMRVGDSVVAIGNALGQFQNTVTTGVLSGYGRSVEASRGSGGGSDSLDNLFQTDAAINQGNSGGPLVNLKGEVIGINTAVAGGAENIGFAIPIDNVKGLIASVRESGTLERPFIGVVYIPLTDAVAKEYGLSVMRGAFVPKSEDYGQATVIADSPAAKAGVKEGDVITKVDDKAVDQYASLASLLGKQQPGDTVELTIHRDGKTETISVKLGTLPTSTAQ